jgi:hypothetical protein
LLNQIKPVTITSHSSALLLICYFSALIAFSLLKRSAPSGSLGKVIQLFRAFFPSWRFFEDFDEAPVLYYRLETGDGSYGTWERCLEKPKRRALDLVFNPHGNYVLAAGSLVQQLLSDIEQVEDSKPDEAEKLVSYQLTKNLVSYQIKKHQAHARAARFQFKISANTEDLLLSPSYALSEALR